MDKQTQDLRELALAAMTDPDIAVIRTTFIHEAISTNETARINTDEDSFRSALHMFAAGHPENSLSDAIENDDMILVYLKVGSLEEDCENLHKKIIDTFPGLGDDEREDYMPDLVDTEIRMLKEIQRVAPNNGMVKNLAFFLIDALESFTDEDDEVYEGYQCNIEELRTLLNTLI